MQKQQTSDILAGDLRYSRAVLVVSAIYVYKRSSVTYTSNVQSLAQVHKNWNTEQH